MSFLLPPLMLHTVLGSNIGQRGPGLTDSSWLMFSVQLDIPQPDGQREILCQELA